MITVEVIHGLLKNICSHILYYIFIAEIYTRMGFEEIFVILTWIKKSLIAIGTAPCFAPYGCRTLSNMPPLQTGSSLKLPTGQFLYGQPFYCRAVSLKGVR